MNPIPWDAPQRSIIRSLVPEQFHRQTWIAGSAATHWGQNADVDAWVVGLTDAENFAICASLQGRGLFITINEFNDPGNGVVTQYVINSRLVYSRNGIQLLLSNLSMQEIVNEFDISCHAAAVPLDDDGREPVTHAEFDADSLRPLFVRQPDKTLRRMFRFGERYNRWDWLGGQTKAVEELVIDAFNLQTVTTQQYWHMRRIDKGF